MMNQGDDPGPVGIQIHVLQGQLGQGWVPIYYRGSQVCLTLCLIPEWV